MEMTPYMRASQGTSPNDFYDKCPWRWAPPPEMKIGLYPLPTAHCRLFLRSKQPSTAVLLTPDSCPLMFPQDPVKVLCRENALRPRVSPPLAVRATRVPGHPRRSTFISAGRGLGLFAEPQNACLNVPGLVGLDK